MSFLDSIRNFDKKALAKSETIITNKAGKKFIEKTDENGNVVLVDASNSTTAGGDPSSATTEGGSFFIVAKPDPKLHKILDGFYIGSQDAAHNLEGLQEAKITHILNVSTGIKNAYPEQFQYKVIELLDVDTADITSHFASVIDFIEQGRKSGGVLVHCNAGVSRSAAACLAYLIGSQGMSYESAYKHLKESRSVINPNEGFVRQLREYEQRLQQEKKKAH